MTTKKSFRNLPSFDPESGDVLTVVKTPKGSRNKYAYNASLEFSSYARRGRVA